MEFACCAAVRGSGANKEYAHHLLHLCRGDVQVGFWLCLHMSSAFEINKYHKSVVCGVCVKWCLQEDIFRQMMLSVCVIIQLFCLVCRSKVESNIRKL